MQEEREMTFNWHEAFFCFVKVGLLVTGIGSVGSFVFEEFKLGTALLILMMICVFIYGGMSSWEM